MLGKQDSDVADSEEYSTSLTSLPPSSSEATTSEEKAALAACEETKWVESNAGNMKLLSIAPLLLIAVINFANFVNGIYMAIPGPTLLFLADRVSRGVGQVSTVLAGRSAGNLLGAFAATAISRNRTKYWDSTMRLGVSFIVYGISTIAIPFVTNLWALIAVLSIGGFLFGFTNTGFLAVQLDIWGEKKSRPLMQLFQAVFSIGAMIAPLIATPFLEMAAEGHYKKSNIPTCMHDNASEVTVFSNATTSVTSQGAATDRINPVTWVYAIIGALHLIAAVTMMVMSLSGVEDRARNGHKVVSEAREEEPICRIAGLLLCVVAFYAFQVAAVNLFASYIYSVSYCSKLQFSISKASTLNSLYWGIFIVGRVIAFYVSSKTRPSTLITACILTLVTSAALMSTMGENNEWAAWAATSLWALAISPLFGSGVSWVSRITNVSGRYAVIFEIGAAIGAVGAFPIAGLLFDFDPYSVIHFVSGLIGLLALSYVGMRFTGRRHLQRKRASAGKR